MGRTMGHRRSRWGRPHESELCALAPSLLIPPGMRSTPPPTPATPPPHLLGFGALALLGGLLFACIKIDYFPYDNAACICEGQVGRLSAMCNGGSVDGRVQIRVTGCSPATAVETAPTGEQACRYRIFSDDNLRLVFVPRDVLVPISPNGAEQMLAVSTRASLDGLPQRIVDYHLVDVGNSAWVGRGTVTISQTCP